MPIIILMSHKIHPKDNFNMANFPKLEASLWTYKNLNLVFFFVAVHENLFENPYRFYIMLMAER